MSELIATVRAQFALDWDGNHGIHHPVESARVLPNQTVLIAGNRIQAVGPSARVKIPTDAQVVDATGKYLIPGLWD
ncbi:hypothetical protein BH23GEM5_BH23GEM5_25870 [soil metagenome]